MSKSYPSADGQGKPRPRPPGPEERRGATATSRAGESGDQPPRMRDQMRQSRFWITLVVLFLLNWLLVPLIFPEPQDRLTISYTEFKKQVQAGNVSEITGRGEAIQGTFKQGIADPAPTQPAAGQGAVAFTAVNTRCPQPVALQ